MAFHPTFSRLDGSQTLPFYEQLLGVLQLWHHGEVHRPQQLHPSLGSSLHLSVTSLVTREWEIQTSSAREPLLSVPPATSDSVVATCRDATLAARRLRRRESGDGHAWLGLTRKNGSVQIKDTLVWGGVRERGCKRVRSGFAIHRCSRCLARHAPLQRQGFKTSSRYFAQHPFSFPQHLQAHFHSITRFPLRIGREAFVRRGHTKVSVYFPMKSADKLIFTFRLFAVDGSLFVNADNLHVVSCLIFAPRA